jgi:outer membrane lipoprotein-sorting protein
MKAMPHRPNTLLAFALCLFALSSTSCLARRRLITRKGGSSRQTLLTADADTLVRRVAQIYNSIHDFNATVDMTPALGSAEKSRITEYKDVRGYVLFRKPFDIRIIGLYPVVRNKAFDMVSNGTDFKLFIPAKDRFVVGRNAMSTPSPNKIENLRPQHFLEAMLVPPVDPATEKPVLENYTDEDNADYVLHLIREGPDGQLHLARTIWFERIHLTLARQMVFDDAGNILADARYSQWQPWDNVGFPKVVEINRPRDEYAVVITIVKMDVNKGVTDDKFALEQPPGTTLQVLGEKPAAAPASADRKQTK